MIAKLKGIVDSKTEDHVVLDVGGVGYRVFCPARVLSRLPGEGEAVVLYIESHVREDHFHLYGFLDPREREWFRVLSTVQGVGNKVALAILSTLSADQIGQAIVAEDRASVSRAPGVGPKLAARICQELKDKAVAMGSTPSFPPKGINLPASGGEAAPVASAPDAVGDAVSALVNLGYGRSDAYTAAATAATALGEGATTQKILSAALKDLGKGSV
ncbi:MAG: Holliday junction branch migration protein RuvA [Rhodospirillum sp.]|nr:Holliday junction branch migration protein RuvA [Rhodospirillum sp.]MCF8488032.1 Holliday junction branch migration protein RuvA [Rhodospirillum sp.]MCF8500299.1 Holliday junction branch migration protein RuvA [Rhodospirillum sp.]